jgi:hypothetical protein
MQASKALPEGYTLHRTIDLSKDRRLLVVLNVIALALLVAFGFAFTSFAARLRPDVLSGQGGGIRWLVDAASLLWIVVALVIVLVLHELVHALFFWITTKERPVFGLRATYAYAAAPGWYIPRRSYLVVGLSPLVLITLLGLLWLPIAPIPLIPALLFGLSMNASGAVGDLFIVTMLCLEPPGVLVCDRGDAVDYYRPLSAP